jgi:hypothetical protein
MGAFNIHCALAKEGQHFLFIAINDAQFDAYHPTIFTLFDRL